MSGVWIETGRTSVQAWECDENDHLNVQFYAARVSEASPFVLDALGIGPESGLTLAPVQHHTRYRRELRMGDTMLTRSTILAVEPGQLKTYHELLGGDGVAASFIATERLVDSESGATAPWPADAVTRAAALTGTVPDESRPRSLDPDSPVPDLTLEQALSLDTAETYRGVATAQQCDHRGFVTPQHLVGRFSDGVTHLWGHIGLDMRDLLDSGRGSIVLETHVSYLRPVRAGDLLVGRSALVEMLGKAVRFAHFMFDKRTGQAVACNQAVATILDHKARKAVGFTDAEKASLKGHLVVLPA